MTMPEPGPSHVYKNTLREITGRGTFRVAQFGELTCITCAYYSPEFPGGVLKDYPFCTLHWCTVEGPNTHRCDSHFQKTAAEKKRPTKPASPPIVPAAFKRLF